MTAALQAKANGTQGSLQVAGTDVVVFDGTGIVSGVNKSAVSQMPFRSAQLPTNIGTAVDLTGLPTWMEQFSVSLKDVSTAGTSAYRIQLGSTTIQTTGYTGVVTRVYTTTSVLALSAGFDMPFDAAAFSASGTLVFTHLGGNLWVCHGVVASPTSTVMTVQVAGYVQLSGPCDRIRFTTSAGDTLDSGFLVVRVT